MADPQALATFLAAVQGVHVSGSGTKETSFYTAIDNLLDGFGDTLKPKVRCVMQLTARAWQASSVMATLCASTWRLATSTTAVR
jgi:hypothetical protein